LGLVQGKRRALRNQENAGHCETKLGRWLGVSHTAGTLISFWILKREGKVLSSMTVQRATNLELQTDENNDGIAAFNRVISERHGQEEYFVEDDKGKVTLGQWGDSLQYDSRFTPDAFDDTYLNMELALPRNGDEVEFAKVVKRLRDKNGLPIGTANDNRYSIPGFARSNSMTGIDCGWRPTSLWKIYLRRLAMRETVTSCLMRSCHIGQTGRN
jgi:hypothetical protein